MSHSAFILIGRKEKAGNTSRPRSFHHAHCFNVGEGDTSSNTTFGKRPRLNNVVNCAFGLVLQIMIEFSFCGGLFL